MSSDNLNYDEGALRAAIKQSKMGMSWILDINAHENKSTCGDKPNVSNHADRTNVESKLRNLDKPLSNDPSKKVQQGETLPTLNYSPPYLCERAINHPDLKIKIPFYNEYQQSLKNATAEELGMESELANQLN
jgi:hypothetical protein